MSKLMTAAFVAILTSLSIGVTLVWADGPLAGEAQPAGTPSSQLDKPISANPNQALTGTPIDRALRSLDLTNEVKVKVRAALRDWKAKADAHDEPIIAKREAVVAQIGNETDQAKKAELIKQFRELTKSLDPADRYRSAKAALKDTLTDEQLARIDETVKSGAIGLMVDHMNHYVNWLEKTVPDFKLDDGQKTRLAEAIQAAKEKLAKEDAASVDLKAQEAILELHKMFMNDLLTDAQRAQFMQFLGKARQPASQPI